jgi:regulator of sigma E protease
MSIFISILIFIAILTILIFIHEMGHYLTAKRNKVKVEEFGLGLPPRIWGFEKGGTLWSINWIPLGGFCKMAGEEDPAILDSLAGKSVKARIIVLSAGSIAMLLFPLILLPFAYMLPLSRVAEDAGVKISAVISGSPAEQAGIRANDTLVSIDGKKVNYFSDAVSEIQNESDSNPGQPVTLLVAYENGSIRGNFSAVPITNPPAGQEALGLVTGVLITEVTNNSPAYNASIKVGDIIISVDGKVVDNYSDANSKLADALAAKQMEKLFMLTAPAPNQFITILVARNTSEGIVPTSNQSVAILVARNTSEGTETLTLNPVPRVNPSRNEGRLGVQLQNYLIMKNKAYAPWDAIPKGLAQYGSIFVGIKDSFAMLFSGQVAAKDAFSGPIGIAELTNEVSAFGGPAALFSFAALLSIMLGIMNLFPFPGLDGGRLVFVFVEGLRRGKRVSAKTEGRVHLIGFILLLVLFVVISFNDITKLVHHESFIK